MGPALLFKSAPGGFVVRGVSGFVGDDIAAAMQDASDLWNSFIASGVLSISGRAGVPGHAVAVCLCATGPQDACYW